MDQTLSERAVVLHVRRHDLGVSSHVYGICCVGGPSAFDFDHVEGFALKEVVENGADSQAVAVQVGDPDRGECLVDPCNERFSRHRATMALGTVSMPVREEVVMGRGIVDA